MNNIYATILLSVLFINNSFGHGSHDHADKTKEKPSTAFEIEIGGEFFAKQAFEKKPFLTGLAAIMIDLDFQVSNRLSGFAAFHFDSGIWHSFINRSFIVDEEKDHTDIELHVEEFFVAWNPINFLELKAGRRYSRISRANYMHLADFEFNAKPRVFTTFFGDNHGLAIDGLSGEVKMESEKTSFSFLTEIGRNGDQSNNLIVTSTMEAGFESKNWNASIKGFSIFDHQQNDNPWFSKSISPERQNLLNLTEGLKMNALGASISLFTSVTKTLDINISTETFSRKLGNAKLFGGFGFARATFGKRFSLALMYQAVEIPTIENNSIASIREQSTTLGVSWFPTDRQRLNLEFSNFSNSPFYNNMVLLKYTFNIGITSAKNAECSSRCNRGRSGRGLGRWLDL